jgi:ribosomal protein S18 acetylase RimI-like enzyme
MIKKTYRLATTEDLNQIWSLRLMATHLLKQKNVDQWQFEDPTKASFLHEINQKNLYVLEIDDVICGMFALIFGVEPTYNNINGAWRYNLPYATIHKLALDPEYQHHGIARTMLLKAEEIAREHGINYMRIDTHKDNLQAQKTFLSVGYVYCGDIMVDIVRGDKHRYAYDKLLEVSNESIH